MNLDPRPTLADFLAAPVQEVAGVAPATIIFAPGGTRRATALAGVTLDEYPQWNLTRMLSTCALFFRLGVQNLLQSVGRPQMFAERGRYRDRFLHWVKWGLACEESLDFYRRHDWRVRLIVAGDPIPELSGLAETLAEATSEAGGPTLWYTMAPDYEQLWRWHLHTLTQHRPHTRAEAIQALYGAQIPIADVLISFGKPMISLDILPPLLYDEIQCYWTQRPSYDLDERELRTIFYDYAYLRPTWREDKTGRAEEAVAYRQAWQEGPTLGVGQRLGPFWYPTPTPPTAPPDDEQ